MTIISLLLLASLLPHLTFTALVDVGIVNGKEAKPHSRPYMVSLQINGHHHCGGFLISDEFVMTAAHCQKNQVMTAVVGAHDLKNKNEGSVRIGVKSYHKHPDYSNESNLNDIMLLRLEEKVKLSTNVNLIIIKNKEEIKCTVCCVAGWGKRQIKGSVNDRLMEANVTIIKNQQCKEKWKGSEKYSLSKMMCAYGHGGSCKGDSGGPLVCGNTAVGVMSFGDRERCNSPESQTLTVVVGAHDLRFSKNRIGVKSYIQHPSYVSHFSWNDIMLLRGDSGGPLVCGNTAVGVTSFGYKPHCNDPEKPNVYIKISPYIQWINDIISNVHEITHPFLKILNIQPTSAYF
ncbi:granzyme B(G,H)-like protein [Labeo rohita]|uniref:trypsin n=1 Tax=Labeo rohita TaxID=84645 RepID=A0A498NZ52_LABRO|nr:granzyme B(G,H)-like protein [Labeo rohita]